jgi:hypothetical protein
MAWPLASLVRACAAGLCLLALLPRDAGPMAHAQGLSPRPVTATVTATRVAASLGPLLNIPQTWNNCGPASVAEVLAYWGIMRTQYQTQAVLRADGNTHGMTPYGVPGYARGLGMRALLGVGGTATLVKSLISNGFPVIVSQWVSPSDHIGHYRPIEAYDDRVGVFVSSDPYLGPNHQMTYADFAQIWAIRHQSFIVLYPPAKQALLSAVLASAGWNLQRAYEQDLARPQPYPTWGRQDGTRGGPNRMRDLARAWDEVELGQYAAARHLLQQAAQDGASPMAIGWIRQEIPA